MSFEFGKAIVHERGRDLTLIATGSMLHGGLGGAVAEVLADIGRAPRLVRHGIMDEYSLIAPPMHLYRHYRLDGPGIAAAALEALHSTAMSYMI